MGYPADLFISEDVPIEYMCPVCRDVLQDPKCLKRCEHMFCHTCIVSSLATSPTCPLCRAPASVLRLRTPLREFVQLLDRLKTRCSFYSDGCLAILHLSEIDAHASKCVFNPVMTVTCDCGAELKGLDRMTHSCRKYLKEKIETDVDKINEALKRGHSTLNEPRHVELLKEARLAAEAPVMIWNTMNPGMTRVVLNVIGDRLHRVEDLQVISDQIVHDLETTFGDKWVCFMAIRDTCELTRDGSGRDRLRPDCSIKVLYGNLSISLFNI